MSTLPASIPTLSQRFFAPLDAACAGAKNRRSCVSITDEDWLRLGIRRVLSQETSGRGFLQGMSDVLGQDIAPSLFFESLKSVRRLTVLKEVAKAVARSVRVSDPFAQIKSLDNYAIHAGDGTFLDHACHDAPIDGTVHATGHFFGLNLRTHALSYLALADRDVISKRKREHDMHALKNMNISLLRQDEPAGRQVIWVWDRAGIDAKQWQEWKMKQGIYFISRAKENMDLTPMGDLVFDATDPANRGITAYHLVHIASQALRCVHYTCPISKVPYVFISSLTNVEPGVIAALYKARWDVEKIFDEIKNKLHEHKSWATSATAKNIQAHFLCLTHNLLTILENTIEKTHGITNHHETERRIKRRNQAKKQADVQDNAIPPLLQSIWLRCTQRALVFIRWVRNHLNNIRTPWTAMLEALRARYASNRV